MRRKNYKFLISLSILVLTLSGALTVRADVEGGSSHSRAMVAPPLPPKPPEHNPHPPQGWQEERRVRFAVEAAYRQYGPNLELMHAHVIPWSWEQYIKEQSNQELDPNVIVEAQIVSAEPYWVPMAPKAKPPKLKPDEFMVHAYVRFPGNPHWHHLDVVLTEDRHGHLGLRGFYATPIPVQGGHLPPGVVC